MVEDPGINFFFSKMLCFEFNFKLDFKVLIVKINSLQHFSVSELY